MGVFELETSTVGHVCRLIEIWWGDGSSFMKKERELTDSSLIVPDVLPAPRILKLFQACGINVTYFSIEILCCPQCVEIRRWAKGHFSHYAYPVVPLCALWVASEAQRGEEVGVQWRILLWLELWQHDHLYLQSRSLFFSSLSSFSERKLPAALVFKEEDLRLLGPRGHCSFCLVLLQQKFY